MEKPQSVCDLAKWVAAQTEAQELLKAMGDEGKQREILGVDYEWVISTVAGTTPPLKAHASAAKKRPSDVGVVSAAKKRRTS
ncbi:hypothetical protein BDZ89DRAFT_202987 [Hymenopellis radicata]|nr:hypothetical protein BDZ89DRAFT_202987 [Hymenopellis radicata]